MNIFSPQEARNEFLGALLATEHSIWGISPGLQDPELLNILLQKARNGNHVKWLIESQHSPKSFDKYLIQQILEAGAEIEVVSTKNNGRTLPDMVILDQNKVLTGTLPLLDGHWSSPMILLDSPKIINGFTHEMHRLFANSKALESETKFPSVRMYFSASVSQFSLGMPVRLTWKIDGADEVWINHGIGRVPISSNMLFYPKNDTKISLRAKKGQRSYTRTVFLKLIPQPQVHIHADRTAVASGDSVLITWHCNHVSEVTLLPWGKVPAIGERLWVPNKSTTLVLAGKGVRETVQKSLKINVLDIKVPESIPIPQLDIVSNIDLDKTAILPPNFADLITPPKFDLTMNTEFNLNLKLPESIPLPDYSALPNVLAESISTNDLKIKSLAEMLQEIQGKSILNN